MEKYGYKNISSRNEFEKAAKADGRIQGSTTPEGDLTNYGFVDFNKKGSWGMPGETRYYVKTIEDLVKANDKVSKSVMNERKPKGYVGW